MRIETNPAPVACHRCHEVPIVRLGDYAYVIQCDGCYDGAPDSPRRCEYGFGETAESALRDWGGRQLELAGEAVDVSEQKKAHGRIQAALTIYMPPCCEHPAGYGHPGKCEGARR